MNAVSAISVSAPAQPAAAGGMRAGNAHRTPDAADAADPGTRTSSQMPPRGGEAVDNTAWPEAQHAAAVLAMQPHWLGGAVLRAGAGPVRDAWLACLRSLLPADAPLRRMPLNVHDDRLLGGIDLAASLRARQPVPQRGLLAEADGGVVVLAMAERTSSATAARLAAVLDSGAVVVARDGIEQHHSSAIGVVALDEGDADERPPVALADRLALWLDLCDIPARALAAWPLPTDMPEQVAQARALLPHVRIDDPLCSALCAAALAMGIVSLRAPLLASRVACALAALDGRMAVAEDDAALAARWVLGPRATVVPVLAQADGSPTDAAGDQADAPREPAAPQPQATPADASGAESQAASPTEPRPADTQPVANANLNHTDGQEDPQANASTPTAAEAAAALDGAVLAAARPTMPAHLLEQLSVQGASRPPGGSTSSAGAGQLRLQLRRGAPIGVRRGDPRGGQRLNLLATLRAAAPWQRLRASSAQQPSVSSGTPPSAGTAHNPGTPRIHVRADDFRVTRFRQGAQTTVIFVVDASGSAALHRLAEAKGAVELLLADCYARRDSVAVLAFRGQGVDLLLPPTRSLVRAKRCLAGLPGGGGTPLASAIDAAALLAEQVRRGGNTPLTVLLTDCRANIARDGSAGRPQAEAQALQAASRLRAGGLPALLLDTSPRPHALARQLAGAMGALYLALPQADAGGVCNAVRQAKQQHAADTAPRAARA